MPCTDSIFSVSSDTSFGDLSPSCSFSPVGEHRQTLESKESEEIVEPYQFEPQASKSLEGPLAAASTEGDGDSIGGGKPGNHL